MTKFYTQYHRPTDLKKEIHPDEGLVERTGYRSTEQIVKELLTAGMNLQAYRDAEYKDGEEVPDDAPANRPMLELDALRDSRTLRRKIWDQIKRGKELDEKTKAEAERLKEEVNKEKKDGNP